MEGTSGGGTGSGDISAVLRDLRFNQHNIEHFLHLGVPTYMYLILSENSNKSNEKNPKKHNLYTIHIKKGEK